jgi:hypothetical protein
MVALVTHQTYAFSNRSSLHIPPLVGLQHVLLQHTFDDPLAIAR